MPKPFFVGFIGEAVSQLRILKGKESRYRIQQFPQYLPLFDNNLLCWALLFCDTIVFTHRKPPPDLSGRLLWFPFQGRNESQATHQFFLRAHAYLLTPCLPV